MAMTWELLVERMADLRALQGAIAVLSWDQETYLPPKGATARGEQLATLQAVLHEKLTAPEIGDALAWAEEQQAEGVAERLGGVHTPRGEDDRPALLRALRFDRDRAMAVPVALVRELAALQSRALAAWRDARKRSAFDAFAPHLVRLVQLRREMADALLPTLQDGGRAGERSRVERYDALLEGYEPGMRVARLEPLFARMTDWLAPLVARITERAAPDPLRGLRIDPDAQWRLTLEVLDAMGFDREAGRQDRSAHPFTLSSDPGDVRLTTRIHEELPFSSLFSTIHEAGHGLYEQGLPTEHRRDLLCAAASMGLHESQSRLWENMIGRSRPFWTWLRGRLPAFCPAVSGLSLAELLRGVNRVERSLVRVEADEVTYNLHIVLRFRLELALLRGHLAVTELPAAWNDECERLLGIRPRRDAEGVLQDVHWAWGDLGYFPTYAIGNLYAATLFAAARRALPGLDEHVAAGRFAPLRGWLRDNVHRFGRTATADEIVRRATGAGLRDDDFRAYLEAKYATTGE